MNSQKLKNKKIIGLIYWLLSALLGLGGLLIVFSLVFFTITLFNPNIEPFIPGEKIAMKGTRERYGSQCGHKKNQNSQRP